MFIGGIKDAIDIINNLFVYHKPLTLPELGWTLFKIFGAWFVALSFFAPFFITIAMADKFLEPLRPKRTSTEELQQH